MTNGPVEPAAEMRAIAKMLRQMFTALQQEGFTTAEAISIIGKVLAATAPQGDAS